MRSGSIWNEPQDWMMGLLKNERILAARWSCEDGLIMKYGFKTIILAVSALSQNPAYVVLEYYFDNYDQCETEIKNQQKSVL